MSYLLDLTKIYEMRKMELIDTIFDAVKLSEFVYSLIPHSSPYESLDVTKDLLNYYELFKKRRFFGWCHTNALFLHILLKEYGRESIVYNYGFRENKFTHVVVIITIKDEKYLLDPYFNRYYVNEEGIPLTFNNLLDKIKNSPTDVKSVYGELKKEVYQEEVSNFVAFSPEELEQSVINAWKASEFNEFMLKNFNDTNPLLLIPNELQKMAVLTKYNGTPYYDFF